MNLFLKAEIKRTEDCRDSGSPLFTPFSVRLILYYKGIIEGGTAYA